MHIFTSQKLVFGLVILMGIILRIIQFNQVPPSINWDEASLGYNAYSILKTGKDEWGRFMPLTFEAFGDYKLPVYIYTLVPFISLFGLYDWVVRIPSLLSGILAIILIFFIAKKLTANNKWALAAAFLLAINPWHIFISRVGLEAHLAFALFLSGLALFLLGIDKNRFSIFQLTSSAVLFGLTLFTYNSARIFVPLFLFSLIFIYRLKLLNNKRLLILPILVFGLFILAAGILAVNVDSSSRYFWVTIIDQGAINFLNESRNHSTLPDVITNLIYNRYSYFLTQFVNNYLSHFSLEFLFLEGGSQYQFSVPHYGLVYLFELPLLIWGIIKLTKSRTYGLLILAWLLLSPIPSAITREAPHALRSVFIIGVLPIISGIGLVEVYSYIKKKIQIKYKMVLISIGIVIITVQTLLYLQNYFIQYPKVYSLPWQYGMKEAIQEVKNANQDVYISKKFGEPHIFYLFYTQYDPAKYQNSNSLVRYDMSNWRWVDKLDAIYFVEDSKIKELTETVRKALVITSPDNVPDDAKYLKSIYFLDGSRAFDIVEVDNSDK